MSSTAILIKTAPQTLWLLPFSRFELRGIIHAMLEETRHGNALLELCILTDSAMEALNNSTMGCHGPTNILSFPANVPAPCSASSDSPFLGSLALSPETLQRECLLYGQNATEHTIRLLAHGIAHLLGYDHGHDMDVVTERLISKGTRSANAL